MKMKNAMQLKALVKNMASANNISAQLVMQNYMLERLLERIALSEYQQKFIIKGGLLISAIVGLDSRTTMDLDTTVKGITLSQDNIRKVFDAVCSIDADDHVSFDIVSIEDIRETDDYPGLRVSLKACLESVSVSLSVDVTTGDRITPREIEFGYRLLFENRSIRVMAYNLETILAEKMETVLSRGIANTRPRDFYDIHVLVNLRKAELNISTLRKALIETATKRGSKEILQDYKSIISRIESSEQLRNFWKKYQSIFSYASGIAFSDTCQTIERLLGQVM